MDHNSSRRDFIKQGSLAMLAAIAGGKGISIGLLVKSGEVFQQLSQVDTIVFDKTGTLTKWKTYSN